MDKNKAIKILLISIIALFSIVIIASFAYFSSSIDRQKQSEINLDTDANSYMFMSSTSDQIYLDLTNVSIGYEDASDDEAIASDTAVASSFLMSSSKDKISSCTFDIIYIRDTESDIYERSAGVEKEFTIMGTPTTQNAEDYTEEEYKINTPTLDEINFDELTWKEREYETEDEHGEKVTETRHYAELVKNVRISSNSLKVATIINYEFKVNFYNSTLVQDSLMNKKYLGIITIDNDSVKCK